MREWKIWFSRTTPAGFTDFLIHWSDRLRRASVIVALP